MRQAIHDVLVGDQAVSAIVGERIYRDLGPVGKLSRAGTPDSFNTDGDLLPSIILRIGPRTRPQSAPVGGAAEQAIELWCYAQSSWDVLQALARAARACLDGRTDLVAVNEPTLAWHRTRWDSDAGEALDGDLRVPVLVSTYQAEIRETERTPE